MKNYFIVSLCKNGILGGGIIVDAEKITYRTGKLTVPEKYRNLELKYEDIVSMTRGMLFILPTVSFQMKNDEAYKFVVFSPKRFLRVVNVRRNQKLLEKWISVFGQGVDEKMIEEHVTSQCNYLWHLFTWGNVACLEGHEARKAFDELKYSEAIRFYNGYSGCIEDVSIVERVWAKDMDEDPGSDVYIVAKDFSWTYVRTHERECCGPYFCVKER